MAQTAEQYGFGNARSAVRGSLTHEVLNSESFGNLNFPTQINISIIAQNEAFPMHCGISHESLKHYKCFALEEIWPFTSKLLGNFFWGVPLFTNTWA